MNRIVIAPTTLQDTPPLEYIEAAAHAGYDGIGLRVHRSPGLPFFPVVGNAALIRDMKHAIADGDLEVLDLYSFYLQPDTDVAGFAPALELGAEFGAKYATVMGADTDWSRQRDNFAHICDLAKHFGLICSLEFAVVRPLATLPQTVQLIAESKREAVICIDPLHLVCSGGSPADVKALDAKLLPYAQISDGVLAASNMAVNDKPDPGTRAMPGEGVLPLREFIAVLPKGIPLSVELPHELAPSGTSARNWAKITLERTHKYLEKAH